MSHFYFVGPKEEFLATLNMSFTIAPAKEEDLKRAEELTVRMHQLNIWRRACFGDRGNHRLSGALWRGE